MFNYLGECFYFGDQGCFLFSEFGFLFFLKLQKQAGVNVPGVLPVPVGEGVAAAKRVAPKPVQKKVSVKPKPVEVIEISPDEEKDKTSHKKKETDASAHKKKEADVHKSKNKSMRTLTSVLTARSKVDVLKILLKKTLYLL